MGAPKPMGNPGSTNMTRGPKKHMKRLNAPKHWMLDKMGGTWAPRPSTGPHKLRECLPLILVLRNRLKYALTGKEVQKILMQRLVKIDGKVQSRGKRGKKLCVRCLIEGRVIRMCPHHWIPCG